MTHELYKKYRPKKLKDIIGQDDTVSVLKTYIEKKTIPHAILFAGPSGCGKTTLARILKKKVGCAGQDFSEINASDFRGIDTIRDIRKHAPLGAIGGGSRCWLVDECHLLTKDAQNSFLKLLEDTPEHVYFFLATTEPKKLLATIRTRCTDFNLKLLAEPDIQKLIKKVCKAEKVKLSDDVVEKLIDHSDGSARKCLVLLEKVAGLKKEEEQLDAIESEQDDKEAIEVFSALINPQTNWKKMVGVLRGVQAEPESIRWLVLGCCNNIMLNAGRGKQWGRANTIIEAFMDPFYDSKKAGLISACYEVITG